jgi:hypothetical protein
MYVRIRAYCFDNIKIFELKNVGTGLAPVRYSAKEISVGIGYCLFVIAAEANHAGISYWLSDGVEDSLLFLF